MGLFGFGKKKEAKDKKFTMEYFEPTWTDKEAYMSPLGDYRNICKMPSLRYMPTPVVGGRNKWTGEWVEAPVVDNDCEIAKKYPEVYHLNALPVKGFESHFYPFSDATIQMVEDIIKKLESINNIEKIRAFIAEQSDEVITMTGEWFLGDYMTSTANGGFSNDLAYWEKMTDWEIRLYGRKEIL